ncbi:MAG: signal peptidase II [Gammaproteobacteria bacterium CG22_combo_CG10-13_8_21_14_all_40_8]|nr:MAG: signal peptidase II [Gammaproteobacteria bacterium CG22_combo_CG10-13_8_21_14_all_40_8]
MNKPQQTEIDTKWGQLKWLWLAVLVLVLDQLSKWWALEALTPYQPVNLMPGFNWKLAFNKGAAFSFLSESGGWQQVFFALLAIIISTVMLVWMRKMDAQQSKLAIACSLVIGGAMGNLIDRLYHGQVTDFIDWYYQSHHWPTFNVADSFIMLGAFIIALDGIFQPRKPDSQQSQTEHSK